MDKVLKFIDRNGCRMILVLCLFTFFKTCTTNGKIERMEKEIKKELSMQVDSLAKPISEKKMEKMLEKSMWEFLLYEDELDKKKITISQIKDKINE